jgi:hypothetical protein
MEAAGSSGTKYPVTDFRLPHQILLEFLGNQVAVTCNCLCKPSGKQKIKRHNSSKTYIEARVVFPADEAIAAYKRWHAERGLTVTC